MSLPLVVCDCPRPMICRAIEPYSRNLRKGTPKIRQQRYLHTSTSSDDLLRSFSLTTSPSISERGVTPIFTRWSMNTHGNIAAFDVFIEHATHEYGYVV